MLNNKDIRIFYSYFVFIPAAFKYSLKPYRMKAHVRFLQIFLTGAAIVALQACDDPIIYEILWWLPVDESSQVNSNTTQTLYGPAEPVGDGTAQVWVSWLGDGTPLTAGVKLSENVLDNFPEHSQEYVLEFPDGAGTSFYTHAKVDWYPAGSESSGTSGLSHFNIQFFVSGEEPLAAGPELTKEYLLSHQDEEVLFNLPDDHQRDGWYATKYRVLYSSDQGDIYMALTDLRYRSAAPGR
jgi:hypothetical protein